MKTDSGWAKRSDWVLSRMTMPPTGSVRQSYAVLVLMLLAIGVADGLSGLRVSLAVFYLLPILLATAWFRWRIAAGMAAASVCIRVMGDFIANDKNALPLWSWWNSASQLLVFLFVVWVFSNLIGVYREVAKRVSERTAELLESVAHRHLLQQELINVSAHERNSMGQELHDDICQHLVGTALAAKVLAQRLAQQQSPLAGDAHAIIRLIEEGTGKTRQLARGLLLSAIEPGQLADKLRDLAEEGSRSGVACRFHQAGQVQVADAGTAAELYRIAQEAMRNALRHAGASQVGISLVGDPNAVCLMVEDDGRGLPDDEPRSGMGLPIMSHRAAYIGATLTVMPSEKQGTRVVCHLPTAASRLTLPVGLLG